MPKTAIGTADGTAYRQDARDGEIDALAVLD